MAAHLKIDFVSDVSCPWCVIGLRALETAVASLGADIHTEIHFQPFELNPQMAPGGQDLDEHLLQKYGATRDQFAATREAIRARGEALGFTFDLQRRGRIYNTFDCHRLLHWAQAQGRQQALKHALFSVYFTAGENPSAHDVLLRVAGEVGLDTTRAAEILASDEYAAEVRAIERRYTDAGIHAVPAIIINDQVLIEGGQPTEVFAQALRQVAQRMATERAT